MSFNNKKCVWVFSLKIIKIKKIYKKFQANQKSCRGRTSVCRSQGCIWGYWMGMEVRHWGSVWWWQCRKRVSVGGRRAARVKPRTMCVRRIRKRWNARRFTLRRSKKGPVPTTGQRRLNWPQLFSSFLTFKLCFNIFFSCSLS